MKKGNEELEAWLSRMLSPRINFRFFEVPMDEGTIVLMEIPCAEKQPVQFAGGEYIRIGTNKKNLKEYPDKERELWRTFDSTPYELRIAMGALMIAKDLKKFESLHRRTVRVVWYKENSRLDAIRERILCRLRIFT